MGQMTTGPGRDTPPGAVIPFYAGGAVAFFVLCLLLFISPASLTTHHFNPHLLSVVHTAALGWGTMIIFGAAHQLLPVIFERNLFSPATATLCFYTLTAGTVLLVFSFWDFRTGWLMMGGGALVILSVLMYAVNVIATASIYKRRTPEGLFIVISALWLLLTVSVGLLLAVNFTYPFFSKNHLEVLSLHAHAGLAGWFLQLITGVSIRLVPMFLVARSSKGPWLWYALVLQNTGMLLLMADGYFFGPARWRMILYGIIVASGIAAWLGYLYNAYQKRMKKRIDVQMKHTFFSFAALIAAVLLMPVVLYAEGYRWAILYGMLLFMGWITGIILGKTFKTLPFIVWNMHYKNLTGKVAVPLPKDLYSEAVVLWQYRIFITASGLLAAGILLDSLAVIRVASAVWLLLSLLYLFNVMKVLFHRRD